VQLDSIAMLLEKGCILPQMDLVVIDESESLLHHTTAKTLAGKQRFTFDTLCALLRSSTRVLVMDALLGGQTRAFMRALGKQPRVVRNIWRSDRPRKFVFTNSQPHWLKSLIADLKKGRHCAISSMAADVLTSIKNHLVAEGILREDQILIIEGTTDDEIKQAVRYVNKLWVRFPLVMWSPAIEAGTDFNQPHFHKLYVILCSMSTAALGAVQSTGRVRQLEDTEVLVWCKRGVSWKPDAERFTCDEAVQQLR